MTVQSSRAASPGGEAPVPADADLFRQAMRLTASGVAVIATDGPQGRTGITVSTFQSLSTEPPTVMACIRRDSRHLAAIEANGCFTANVLSVGDEEQARIFAAGTPEARAGSFDSGAWRILKTGAPALNGAICSFDCILSEAITYASHRIVIGTVVAIGLGSAEPLIYAGRGFRRLQAGLVPGWLAKGEFDIPI